MRLILHTHCAHKHLEPIKPHFKAMPLVPRIHIQTSLGAAVSGKLFVTNYVKNGTLATTAFGSVHIMLVI